MEDWTVCRLCLQSSEEPLKFISGSFHNSQPYRSIYFTVTGRCLTDYKSIPMQICNVCEENLISAYTFRELCFQTEEKLKEMLFNVKAEAEGDKTTDEQDLTIFTVNELEGDAKKEGDLEENLEGDFTDPFDQIAEQEEILAAKEEEKQKKILCKRCKTVFRGLDNFKRHKCKGYEPVRKIKAKPQKRSDIEHECMVCKKIIRGTHITTHLDYHNGIKRYECEHCGKRFFWLAAKKTHIQRDHLKKKSYKCPHCPKEYWMVGTRNIHVRKNHLQKIDYQCELCGKGFALRYDLKKHMNTHIEGGPCSICGETFKSLNRLNYHKRTHHKSPPKQSSSNSQDLDE
ncbi:zinc finger protein 558-like [Lutzomyia longipalpis]|uniref:zinc finger protein 558-like n=1 Tax=Lutzomyia longipalpis TaxID=7200 RepID=UPI002483864B|nr:zinc finger protein 558-like [Lutzomyia longipalpis]